MSANSEGPRKRGRPSDYDPKFADQAEKLCLLGATDEEIADIFGKSVSTINAWKIEHPEFSEAIKRGKLPADAEVAASLYKRANWLEYTEQQAVKVREVIYGDNGKKLKEIERVEVVEVRKMLPPCTTAMIYWSKNRRPANWRDKRDVEVTTRTHEQALAELESAIDGEHRDDERAGTPAQAQTRH